MTTTHTIRCGNCKGEHETTEQVRTCYGNSGKLGQTELPKPDLVAAFSKAYASSAPGDPTEKQLAFIERLKAERPSADVGAPVTKREASELIDRLLKLPKEVDRGAGGENTVVALLRDVSDGYYALPSKTGTNDLDFIVVVTRGEKRYVNRYLGGQGPVLIPSAEQRAFAKELGTKTPEQLIMLGAAFGLSLGRCGKCGRTLTDEMSRARGFGPDCWSQL